MKESLLRTLVPILYAILVRLGVVEWLGVDDVLVQSLVTLVVTGAIYVVLRFAEAHKAAVGWLLGYASQPSYGEVPPNPPVEPYADPAKVDHPLRRYDERGHGNTHVIAVIALCIAVVVLLILILPALRAG